MADGADERVVAARARLAALLRTASEELLADGDADGARVALEALKDLRDLGGSTDPKAKG